MANVFFGVLRTTRSLLVVRFIYLFIDDTIVNSKDFVFFDVDNTIVIRYGDCC